jgi:amino acid adenylation domain-containing protein
MNGALTYNELNKLSNLIARSILAQSVESDYQIALLFKQGASLISANLGSLKAGKAYVQLDYKAPLAWNMHILQHAGVGLIVTDSEHLALAHELFANSRKILNINDLKTDLSTDNLSLAIAPGQIAYIHYTSGSTGDPKGVVANHQNELYSIMRKTNALHISQDDRISLLRSNNVGATADALLGLLNGATILPLELKEEGLAHLAQWLIEENVSVFTCVATVFRHVVRTLTGREEFPNLRLIHVGGEPVYESDVKLYKKHFSDTCLFVTRLGISETKTVTYYFITKDTSIKQKRVPVGYPLAGYEVLVLDDGGKPLGVNRIGEIAIKSAYLAGGYWRRPELTTAKFLPDPEGSTARIYLTGDLGYVLPDGCVVHIGRKDSQVKIRGQRIETSEIEMTLLELEQIAQAAVISRDDLDNGECLIAYVVPRQGHVVDVGQVRELLKAQLPSYLLPSFIMIVDSLPYTASGKIDRNALPRPAKSRNSADHPYVAASQPIEKVLVKLWVDAMAIHQIGVHDDFFDLGGDSLLAARLVSNINSIFCPTRPLKTLYEATTVAKLSEFLVQHEAAPGRACKIANIVLKIENMSADELSKIAGG